MLSSNADFSNDSDRLDVGDRFLVCGLGSLGQNCAISLAKFGVRAIAIEQSIPTHWEFTDFAGCLEQTIVGDCRQEAILEQAGIRTCRAALLVTASEQVNIEAALAIRQLNPHTRIVLRSSKISLNQLLQEQLGNTIAYDFTELPASAFAFAALGTEILGYFFLAGQRLRAVRCQITANHPWCETRCLYELDTRSQRLLGYFSACDPLPFQFYNWHPETLVKEGDTLVLLEFADERQAIAPPLPPAPQRTLRNRFLRELRQFFGRQSRRFLQLDFKQQVRRIALASGLIVASLLACGTFLIHLTNPGTTWFSAFSATAILLLGGYSDLFGDFYQGDIPQWLQLFSLCLTLIGTVFVGILYALLTEALLSSQFQFVRSSPPVPHGSHILLIGMGRIGTRVALMLQSFKQAVVGITLKNTTYDTFSEKMPVIQGFDRDALTKANIETAKSAVIVTDDEIANLEVALTIRCLNPRLPLVIRTSGAQLSAHLSHLLPGAQILDVYAVAAEVFAGAAFGENILSLFRCENQTVLVTEYQIEAGDTLIGLLLADIAYGYGVVPLLHQKHGAPTSLLPTDDTCLAAGDRLVVLAAIGGLRRIELGRRSHNPKHWRVRVEQALTEDAQFEGANILARISGCSLATARNIMDSLPATLGAPLYHAQALRLIRNLKRNRVKATLLEPKDARKS